MNSVFVFGGVAEILGEDEHWLDGIAIEMEPEDGGPIVWGTDDPSTTAFTGDGHRKPSAVRRRAQNLSARQE